MPVWVRNSCKKDQRAPTQIDPIEHETMPQSDDEHLCNTNKNFIHVEQKNSALLSPSPVNSSIQTAYPVLPLHLLQNSIGKQANFFRAAWNSNEFVCVNTYREINNSRKNGIFLNIGPKKMRECRQVINLPQVADWIGAHQRENDVVVLLALKLVHSRDLQISHLNNFYKRMIYDSIWEQLKNFVAVACNLLRITPCLVCRTKDWMHSGVRQHL